MYSKYSKIRYLIIKILMTWAQASGRNFNLSQCSTPSRVSPCSYNVPRSELVKPTYKKDPKKFQPRVTYDTPDLITPGPGAYNCSNDNGFPSPPKLSKGSVLGHVNTRPQSSIFLSRSIRDSYRIKGAPDQMFGGFPSSADYGSLTEWGKKRSITSTPHHPRKLKKNYQKEQRCNYLDERGRFVYVKENNSTEADIGPGYYSPERSEKAVYQNSRKSQISNKDISTDDNWVDVKLASSMPSPDQYDTDLPDTRLPVTIKKQYESKKQNEVCDTLTDPPKDKIESKRPNSIFLSKVPRNLFEGTHRPDYLDTPSPADYGNLYDPRDQRKLQTQQKRSRIVKGLAFGSKAVRFDKSVNNTPGPADYSVTLPPNRHEYSSMKATSQFVSQSDPKGEIFANQPSSTPQNVGPGSYNIENPKLKAQMSPAFIDGSSRLQFKDNGNPSPGEYDIKMNYNNIDATMINTRYEKQGDWIFQTIPCSPSPESYNISRDLSGPNYSFPRSKTPKKKKKEDIGPGSYEVNTSSVIEHSFNALVPKY